VKLTPHNMVKHPTCWRGAGYEPLAEHGRHNMVKHPLQLLEELSSGVRGTSPRYDRFTMVKHQLRQRQGCGV
jgi:hypothetical protein